VKNDIEEESQSVQVSWLSREESVLWSNTIPASFIRPKETPQGRPRLSRFLDWDFCPFP